MHNAGSSRWQTVIREVAIIVAGVLCALAGQAWWQNRQDSGREREYIRQLSADTRENEQRLNAAITQDSSTAVTLRRMSDAVYSASVPPSADSIVSWMRGGALGAAEFEPLTGTYGSLLASGDLRLIGTDSLRREIVAYTALLQSDQEMLRFFMSQAFGNPGSIVRALPFLNASMFANSAQAASEAARTSGFRFDTLRRNADFAGVLFALRAANGNRLTHLAALRRESRRLSRTLDAEAPGAPGRR